MGSRGKIKEGRNAPCRCGSGKKYKNCHGKNVAKGGSPVLKTAPHEPDKIPTLLKMELDFAKKLAVEERMKERLTWV